MNLNSAVTTIVLILALSVTGLAFFGPANAATGPVQKQQVFALATPSAAPTASPTTSGTATPDYVATKAYLENQAIALGLTITADAATQQASATAARQRQIDDDATQAAQVRYEQQLRQAERERLELEALRKENENKIFMSQFWEWLKFSAAGLTLFLGFTAARYFIPVLAARWTPVSYSYQPVIEQRQIPEVSPQQPQQERRFRFTLSREGESSMKLGEFPADLLEPIYKMALHVAAGGQFSEDALCGNGKVFQSRNNLFERTRKFFTDYSMLEEVSDEEGNLKYWYITHDMKKYLSQYRAQYEQYKADEC